VLKHRYRLRQLFRYSEGELKASICDVERMKRGLSMKSTQEHVTILEFFWSSERNTLSTFSILLQQNLGL
jgi:hypothetical protein